MAATPLRASDFIATLGVNTHIPSTPVSILPAYVDDLNYLGINQVRDSISAPSSSYISMAQQGIKFTFLIASGGTLTTSSLNAEIKLIDQVNMAVPGSVTAVEGANEPSNFHLTFNGVGGLQGAIDLQKALYAAVHSDPHLAGVPVDYFSGYGWPPLGTGPNPLTTLGLADYDNQHPYPGNGAPAASVSPHAVLYNEPSGIGPAVYTEVGYSIGVGTFGGVNADVQAKYTLDLLMDTAKDGIAKTYLYVLTGDSYGLFNGNSPLKVATGIHNLTTILADTGASAATFTPIAINDTITKLPSTGNSMVIEKSNGAYDIVVWNEPALWNPSTGTEITAASVGITVGLGATHQTVKVFDPLIGSTPIATYSNVSSVNLSLIDHPLIVEVEPGVVGVLNHVLALT